MKIKVVLKEGEAPVEVELTDAQVDEVVASKVDFDQFIPVARHNAEMTKLRKKMERIPTADDLAEDETFLTKVADSKREFFVKALDLKPQMTTEELDKVLTPRLTAATKPLEDQIKTLTTDNTQLMSARLNGDMETACREAGVKSAFVPLVKSWLEKLTKWDADHGQHSIMDSAGEFEFTATPEKGKSPHKGLTEHLNAQAAHAQYKEWFDPKLREGISYQGTKGKKGGADTPLSDQIVEAEKKGDWTLVSQLKEKQMAGYRAEHGIAQPEGVPSA